MLKDQQMAELQKLPLLNQLKQDRGLSRNIFFGDMANLFKQIEDILNNKTQLFSIYTSDQRSDEEQNSKSIKILLSLLSDKKPIFTAKSKIVIALIMASIVHNTPMLLDTLLCNINTLEFLPKIKLQLLASYAF